MEDVLTLAIFLEQRALGMGIKEGNKDSTSQNSIDGKQHANSIFIFPPTPADTPPARQSEDEAQYGYVDPDLVDMVDPPGPDLPTMETVESMMASLVDQGLLHGFISHGQKRFAIKSGVKQSPPLRAGFPNAWATLSAKGSDEVPGWVKEGQKRLGGTVMHLSNARPVGA